MLALEAFRAHAMKTRYASMLACLFLNYALTFAQPTAQPCPYHLVDCPFEIDSATCLRMAVQ